METGIVVKIVMGLVLLGAVLSFAVAYYTNIDGSKTEIDAYKSGVSSAFSIAMLNGFLSLFATGGLVYVSFFAGD